jgi:hypothetical protein
MFAGHNHAAVSLFHVAAANDDVFGWNMHTPPVRVATALDGDAVVASIEYAVLDKHIPA